MKKLLPYIFIVAAAYVQKENFMWLIGQAPMPETCVGLWRIAFSVIIGMPAIFAIVDSK